MDLGGDKTLFDQLERIIQDLELLIRALEYEGFETEDHREALDTLKELR